MLGAPDRSVGSGGSQQCSAMGSGGGGGGGPSLVPAGSPAQRTTASVPHTQRRAQTSCSGIHPPQCSGERRSTDFFFCPGTCSPSTRSSRARGRSPTRRSRRRSSPSAARPSRPPHLSPSLHISPHLSPSLPISPHLSPYLEAPLLALGVPTFTIGGARLAAVLDAKAAGIPFGAARISFCRRAPRRGARRQARDRPGCSPP